MCLVIHLHFTACGHYRAYTIIPCGNPFISGALLSVEPQDNPTREDFEGADLTEQNLDLLSNHDPAELKVIVMDVGPCTRCNTRL